MKFVLENISKSSGRLGHFVQAETGKQFKTPLLLQTTKSGSIPHLSREVFEYISKDAQMLQMSLATMDHMAESVALFRAGGAAIAGHGNDGLSEYVGFKGYPIALMIRDPCEQIPSGHNDKDVVPLFTRRGKESLSATRFMDMIESFAPDFYQGLCDADTNADSAKKRVQKSVDRTEQLMDICYERHRSSEKLKKATLFAPIVGGYNTYARSQSIRHYRDKGADCCGGFLLEGFHNYGLTASEVSSEQLLAVLAHCQKELDADKAKMMPGGYTPALVLELIRMGVDMFDTSYAYCAAVNFKALAFDFDLKTTAATAMPRTTNTETPFVDLTDESLSEDFTPFVQDCGCLACRQHTRAYVHHLYKTKELLGPILLMIHNLYHYMQFFDVIRACISNDNLADLIKLIKYQNSDKDVDYRIYENTKVISRTGLGKGFVTPAIDAAN